MTLGVRPAEDNYYVHCVHKKSEYKIAVATNPQSFVKTNGAANLKDFMNQRFRWSGYGGTITTWGVKLFFIPAILYYLTIWVSLVISFLHPAIVTLLIISLLCKAMFDFLFLFRAAMVFHCRYLLTYFLPLSFIHLILVPVIVIKGNLFSFEWKGRRYTKESEISNN